MGRVVAWKMSLLIALDHPLFGGGPHAVQHLIVWDTYRPFLPTVNFVTTPPPDVSPHAAHSIYFEILGDLGFVGLFLFLGMIAASFGNATGSSGARETGPICLGPDLARLSQISLVIYLVTGAALSMGYFELVYVLVAVVSRCGRIVSQAMLVPVAAVRRGDPWDIGDEAGFLQHT